MPLSTAYPESSASRRVHPGGTATAFREVGHMLLRDILLHKGTKVYSIEPDATLAEVVRRLVDHNCGSLVVCHRDNPTRLLGIITERDILRACAAGRVPLE